MVRLSPELHSSTGTLMVVGDEGAGELPRFPLLVTSTGTGCLMTAFRLPWQLPGRLPGRLCAGLRLGGLRLGGLRLAGLRLAGLRLAGLRLADREELEHTTELAT